LFLAYIKRLPSVSSQARFSRRSAPQNDVGF